MANPRPLFVGGGPERGNQNINQPNIWTHRNQQNQLVNASPLRPAQPQAADPALTQNMTEMLQPMQRPQCQPMSCDKCVMLQQHCDISNSQVARNHWEAFKQYVFIFKQDRVVSKCLMNSKIFLHWHWLVLYGISLNP